MKSTFKKLQEVLSEVKQEEKSKTEFYDNQPSDWHDSEESEDYKDSLNTLKALRSSLEESVLSFDDYLLAQ